MFLQSLRNLINLGVVGWYVRIFNLFSIPFAPFSSKYDLSTVLMRSIFSRTSWPLYPRSFSHGRTELQTQLFCGDITSRVEADVCPSVYSAEGYDDV